MKEFTRSKTHFERASNQKFLLNLEYALKRVIRVAQNGLQTRSARLGGYQLKKSFTVICFLPDFGARDDAHGRDDTPVV